MQILSSRGTKLKYSLKSPLRTQKVPFNSKTTTKKAKFPHADKAVQVTALVDCPAQGRWSIASCD